MLNWPVTIAAAIVIVCVTALVVFRAAFIRLIDRTQKIGKDGANFDQSRDPAPVASDPPLSAEEIINSPISATVLEREKKLERQLKEMTASSEAEKMKALVREFARLRVGSEFLDLSHLIFGSQLQLLIELSSGVSPVPVARANIIYDEAAKQSPSIHATRTFDMWMDFLQTNKMIVTREGGLVITQYGSDFLKYLVDAKRAHNRSG